MPGKRPQYSSPVHSLFVLGTLLSLFGLIGLYRQLRDKSSVLGFIGFIFTFTGSTFFLFALSLEAFVVPPIAASADGKALLDPAGPLFGGTLGLILLVVSSIFL